MEKHLNTLGRTDRPVSVEAAHSLLILQLEISRIRHDIGGEKRHIAATHGKPFQEPRRPQHCLVAAAVVMICLLAAATAAAQSTFGSIRGVAQDQTGASIPD